MVLGPFSASTSTAPRKGARLVRVRIRILLDDLVSLISWCPLLGKPNRAEGPAATGLKRGPLCLGQWGQTHCRISGGSSPNSRVYAGLRRAGLPSPAESRRRAHPAENAVDHVHDQVEAVEIVEHDHVEGSRGRALLPVAPGVEIVVVGPPVAEAVDQPRIAVVREDDRAIAGEDGVELGVG